MSTVDRNTNTLGNQLLTTKDVAKAMNLSETRIRQFCQEGRLGQKFNRRFIILREDLRRFMQETRTNGRPSTK